MPDDLELDDQEPDSPVIRELREKAKRADTAASEAEQLRRENALLRSGLELNEAQTAALAAVHKGDWTKDALTETASTLGFVKTEPEPERPEPDAAAMQRVAAATAGPPPAQPDLIDRINAAQNRDELIGLLRDQNMLREQ